MRLCRAPLPEAMVTCVLLAWWLWPIAGAPAALLRVTRERLADFDSHLVPYLAMRQAPGGWLWDPLVGFGRPVAADPLANIFDPLATIGLALIDPRAGLGAVLFVSLVLAAAAGWALARDAGCGRLAAMVVGLGFATSGFALAHLYAGHLEFILALPSLPLAWLGARRLCAERSHAILWTGIAFALPVLAGGPYFAELAGLIVVVVVGIHGLIALWRGRWRALGLLAGRLALAAALAVGLSAIHLLPVLRSQAVIVRPPLDPFGGSQPLLTAMGNWLDTPAYYQKQAASAHLLGPAGFGFDWWEADAYVGPLVLALAAVGCLSLLWRQRRAMVVEVIAVTVLALALADARAGWSPFHLLLPRLPNALQLHVATRALGITTLSLFLLAGRGLDGVRRMLPRPAGQTAALLLGAGCLAGTVATGRPLLAAQALAAQEVYGVVPLLPSRYHVVAIGPTVPQSAIVAQGKVVADAYYPWVTPAANDPTLTASYVDAWLIRPDVGLAPAPDGSGPPVHTPGLPPTTPPPPQLLLLPGTPVLHVDARCGGQPCALQPRLTFQERGNTATLCADAASPARYVLPIGAAPGWSASANGRPLRLDAPDGLLAVTLPAGSSCAALRYWPPGLVPGAALTAATLIVLIVVGTRRWSGSAARAASQLPARTARRPATARRPPGPSA